MDKKYKFILVDHSCREIYTLLTIAVLLTLLFSFNLMAQEDGMQKVYIGSYSPADEAGIKCYGFNPDTGEMTFLSGTSGIENPSFLAVHSNGRLLYAVSETDGREGNTSGGVASFRIVSSKGELERLNEVSSGGAAPCHISLDRSERVLMAANYNGGNIAAFPLEKDGSLGKISSFHQHRGSGSDLPNQREPMPIPSILILRTGLPWLQIWAWIRFLFIALIQKRDCWHPMILHSSKLSGNRGRATWPFTRVDPSLT